MKAKQDIALAIAAAVALAGGWLLKDSVQGATKAFSGEGLSLRYPASWSRESPIGELDSPSAATLAVLSSSRSGELLPLAMTLVKDSSSGDPRAALVDRSLALSKSLEGYRLLGTDRAKVAGESALVFKYACLDESGGLPAAAFGAEWIVRRDGATFVFSGRGDARRMDADYAALERVVASAGFGKGR